MRDLQVSLNRSITYAATTASQNGTGIDLANLDGAAVFFVFGAWTDGTHTPKLQESDDNSSFSDVAATDQIGTLTAVSSTAGQNKNQKAVYIGKKRYIRPVITCSGTTTGCVEGAYVVTAHQRKLPAGAGS